MSLSTQTWNNINNYTFTIKYTFFFKFTGAKYKSSGNSPIKVGIFKQSKLKVYHPLDKKTIEKYKHAIAVWMCADMQPYNSVEKKGFKHLLSVLCPSFEPPSRKYYSDHKIPQLYENVKNCIKEKLKGV